MEDRLDPERGGYVLRADGNFYKFYPQAMTHQQASNLCWSENATLGVLYSNLSKAILALDMMVPTQVFYVAVGTFMPKRGGEAWSLDHKWVTNDGELNTSIYVVCEYVVWIKNPCRQRHLP